MESHHALLQKDESYEDSDSSILDAEQLRTSRTSRGWRSKLCLPAWLLHGLLIAIYTIFYFLLSQKAMNQGCAKRDLIYSPAREALEYETQVFYSPVDGNPFAGPPRPELDEAWHHLLRNMHIKISQEELDQFGGRSLELSDGSGFVGSLEVYHDLHCLKRIRHYIYKDTYFPNVTEEEWARHTFHTEHCLEHFRELVMCRGDVSLTTFYYRGHKKAAKLLAEHECVNWESLENWVSDRVVDISLPGIVLPEDESETAENGVPH